MLGQYTCVMLKGVNPGQQKVSLLNEYVMSSHLTFTQEQGRKNYEFLYLICWT